MATSRRVALLRGINLGGTRKLPMKDLARLFEEAGARDVVTYIQSGNVVYGAAAKVAKTIPAAVERAIEASFGFEVPVVVRTEKELSAAIHDNPFRKEGIEEKALHFAFLRDTPKAALAEKLDPDRSPPDRFVVREGDIYLCCPNGFGRSKLGTQYFDRVLDTVSTIRNWRTVATLLEMAKGQR